MTMLAEYADHEAEAESILRDRRPKKWTSWRVYPNCGGRATKLFHLSADDCPLECQRCGHHYNPPERKR
jgi:hypothetical protein